MDGGCYNCGDVFFDQVVITFSKANMLEETHYYPHGLPMVALGSQANGFTGNRLRYQSNEQLKELNLGWMDFHNRQYDPQIGRFLSVDPLAVSGGQDRLNPFQAMGNNPVSMVDPFGTIYKPFERYGTRQPLVSIIPPGFEESPTVRLWAMMAQMGMSMKFDPDWMAFDQKEEQANYTDEWNAILEATGSDWRISVDSKGE